MSLAEKVPMPRIPPKRIMGGYTGAIRDVTKIGIMSLVGKVPMPRIPPKRIMGGYSGAI